MKYKVGDRVVISSKYSEGYALPNSIVDIIDLDLSNGEYEYLINDVSPYYSDGSWWIDANDIDHEATAMLSKGTTNLSCEDSTISESGSLRFNEGKPEFSHLSPQFILKMSELMTKSAEKYTRQNWAMKQDLRTAADSMFRHYTAFMSGQDNDEGGSEMSHLLHIAVNAMIMWENYEQYGDEVDTRFYKTLKELVN